MAYAWTFGVLGALFLALNVVNERYNLFRIDHLDAPWRRILAYAWLALFVFGIAGLVVASSEAPVTADKLKGLTFWSLFTLHIVLVVFLLGWWALAGFPPLRRFFNLLPTSPGRAALLGIAVGVGGWALTILLAIAIGLLLTALKLMPENLKPSPMIPWMAALPLWQKAVVVLSAMTVEEAFFRGFLQKRLGLVVSTIAFAIAHAGYGQPFMLVGVGIVSIIIGITFYRTKNLIPCVIAHGVFDAIQLFVVVPLAVKFVGM